jgi:predicted SAM-dependent methyltransferase
MKKKYLNLGCGSRFHKDWVNIDFESFSEHVSAFNLVNGIPFNSNEFDFVYHSHVLEHFSKESGNSFLKECFRVLNPNGIIRIVVPDLETLITEYLNALNNVRNDASDLNKENYDWSVIELIDQLVRKECGGEMLKYWSRKELLNEQHIIDRQGDEFIKARQYLLNKPNTIVKKTFKTKIKSFLLKKMNIDPKDIEIGKFVNSGEIHLWMYDSYSLKKILTEIGFKNIKVQSNNSSYLKDWSLYEFLDTENDKIRKPDSLIIEAIK